jgi:hypothetical protein
MTEAEWLACEDPLDLLLFIRQHRGMRRQTKQRKQRLFSAACCRRIWALISDPASRASVEVAERFADGLVTGEELRAAEGVVVSAWLKAAADDALFACVHACRATDDGLGVSTTTISAVFEQQRREAGLPAEPLEAHRRGACPAEGREQCRLTRCIFGNPFRRVRFAPTSRTPLVASLGTPAYEERDLPSGHLDPGRLAVLSDALEEAGCTDADLLSHLRSPGPHVRGCWALDLVLGKG